MMKEEFVSRLTAEAKERFTDEMYPLIEYVYVWHPAVKTKDDIAAIFNLPAGYRIIKDMRTSASEAEQIELQMQQCRSQRDQVQRELNRLQAILDGLAS